MFRFIHLARASANFHTMTALQLTGKYIYCSQLLSVKLHGKEDVGANTRLRGYNKPLVTLVPYQSQAAAPQASLLMLLGTRVQMFLASSL
jgi:hypothetical protein